MSNDEYEVIIYWSKEDDAYVAEVASACRVRSAWGFAGRSSAQCARGDWFMD